jgi:hypothetical protein
VISPDRKTRLQGAASDERANQVRSDVANQMQASSLPTVERYEVAVFRDVTVLM